MKRMCEHLTRMFAVSVTEALQLVRDRFTLSLLVTIPTVQIVLFGFAVNLNPKDIPIAIAGANAEFVQPIVAQSPYFRVIGNDLPSGTGVERIRAKEALIAIELGESNGRPSVRLFADASDPAAIRPALLSLQIALWKSLARAEIAFDVEWLYNESGAGAWAIAPGLVGVVVMITTLLLGALTLVRERERGTWESLLSAPLTAFDVIVGKLAPLLAFALLQTFIIVWLAQWLFAVPMRGSTVAFLLAALLFALGHLLVGFIVSSCVATQLQAVQTAVFFYLPCMLLSGFMFPFQGMPRWAQILGETLPLTHFVRVARGVMLRGEGLVSTASEMAPVALLVLIALPAARQIYKLRTA